MRVIVASSRSRPVLDAHALAAVKAATKGWHQPNGRLKTFVTTTGATFHLRTYKGHSAEWFFGIADRFWQQGEFFVLVCSGNPTVFVVPVDELLPHRQNFSLDKHGSRKLKIDRSSFGWKLRQVPSLPLARYRDAFDLLT